MKRCSICISLIVFLVLTSNTATAAILSGRVVAIADGDTLTLLDKENQQHKIRLSGIDAPEKSQPFGNRSKQNLSNLVFGKTVDVDWNKKDRYGRTLGKILINGQDANISQLRAGMAWHYKAYEKDQTSADRAQYAQAEADARTRRIGLWQEINPVAPWDFRHGSGKSSPEQRGQAEGYCPCWSRMFCTGPKGGKYCVKANGKKKYHKELSMSNRETTKRETGGLPC